MTWQRYGQLQHACAAPKQLCLSEVEAKATVSLQVLQPNLTLWWRTHTGTGSRQTAGTMQAGGFLTSRQRILNSCGRRNTCRQFYI